jgi:hypothetical protein
MQWHQSNITSIQLGVNEAQVQRPISIDLSSASTVRPLSLLGDRPIFTFEASLSTTLDFFVTPTFLVIPVFTIVFHSSDCSFTRHPIDLPAY